MSSPWRIVSEGGAAPFKLVLHRGEGMALLAMDWTQGQPPPEFAGFAIEYREPGQQRWYAVKNRLHFPGRAKKAAKGARAEQYPSTEAPFQLFRWIHFPRNADQPGNFTYRVTPMFMEADGTLSSGPAREGNIELFAETIPGKLNVCFTRGYVSSQAFADKFGGADGFKTLIPADADAGNSFVPTNPKAAAAFSWMGFEARGRILALLDAAKQDDAEVRVVAFELNLPEIIDRLAALRDRLKIIIDDSKNATKDKSLPGSAESKAAVTLAAAGAEVRRQHMGALQHNKMIVVDGPTVKTVVFGSTNFSWRGLFVQSNNALLVTGAAIVAQQRAAFDAYWGSNGDPATFGASPAADWRDLQVDGLDAQVSMSPHLAAHATQQGIADDMDSATSSLFYSLAFLNLTTGAVTDAVERATDRTDLFVYGLANAGTNFVLQQPDGNPATLSPAALTKHVPEPFRAEASGGGGVRMHHKFVVLDFNLPSARVYTGSYNFSKPADRSNGENLLRIRDGRIATAYMVEALRIFDSYQFRATQKAGAAAGKKELSLELPPRAAGAVAWWDKFWTVTIKRRDRVLFATS